jgi:hypothetical protein
MAYDNVAFCMKFMTDGWLDHVNPRIISEALNELPQSSGMPQFLIGTDEPSVGLGWICAERDDDRVRAEIFPLVEFPSMCLYYALKIERSHGSQSGDSDDNSVSSR